MKRIRRRGREIDPEVYLELIRMATETSSSAPQIEHALLQEFSPGRQVPSQKVIQRVVKEVRPQDPSGPWRLADADDPADAALLLPVLVNLSEEASRWPLTKAEAEWVVRIRKAAPSVPPNAVFTLVRTYMSWEQRGRPTDLLDLVLACAPWSDRTNVDRMERLLSTFGDEGREARRVSLVMVLAQQDPRFGWHDEAVRSLTETVVETRSREARARDGEDNEHERPHQAEGTKVGHRSRRGPRGKREA